MLDSKDIGNRIRKYRKEKKLTQKELAKILDIAESSIQKYEYGKVHIPSPVLNQLADALDVSVWALLGVSKEKAYSDALTYETFGDFYEDESEIQHGKIISQIVEMDKYKGILSLIVNKRMKILNMSLEDLSNSTHIPMSKLNRSSYFDNPDITLDELILLSKALDVSLDYLAGNECIDLPVSYYRNILGLLDECGANIEFNKIGNWFDISYENEKLSTDYSNIKKLKDDILAFTKFKISEMFK